MRNYVSLEFIEKLVCDYFRMTPKELHFVTRKRVTVDKRQIFHYLAKQHTKAKLREIADFGGTDLNHATVISSIKTVSNLIETEKYYRRVIRILESRIIEIITMTEDEKKAVSVDIQEIISKLQNGSVSTRNQLNEFLITQVAF